MVRAAGQAERGSPRGASATLGMRTRLEARFLGCSRAQAQGLVYSSNYEVAAYYVTTYRYNVTMEPKSDMGEKVRFYRLLRRKTIRQLASECGCSPDTIWRLENGRSEPRWRTQRHIAEALGIDWWDLSVNSLPERPEDVSPAPTRPAAAVPAPAADRRPSRAERRRQEREKRKKR